MENASKALLIAGGLLISLLIIGALLLMFNNLTEYQTSKSQGILEADVSKFNNQFETYIRNGIRGSDLISLVNRVINYNTVTDQDGYEKMKISVKIADNDDLIREKFSYDNDRTKYPKLLQRSYNQDNLKNRLTDKVTQIENKYNVGNVNYISNLTSNISKVMDNSNGQEETQKILPKDLSNYGGYELIKEDALVYYEYTQLKRAYFNCTGTAYNQQTGRIVEMNFEFDSSRNLE